MAGFVPLASRGSEWADVKPVPQRDPPQSFVPIDYPADYRDVMDYMRALLLADERSERALKLTAEAVGLNPANYTAWHYRRRLLEALGSDLRGEVAFINDVTRDDNAKNYQLWYHRQAVVGRLGECVGEVAFVNEVLQQDAKNYHAHSYRQWLVRRFQLWDQELPFIDGLLGADPRNNSAWNQRYFVIAHTKGTNKEGRWVLPSCVVRGEVSFAMGHIAKDPGNESAWNYARGVLRSGGGAEEWADAVAQATPYTHTHKGEGSSKGRLKGGYAHAASFLLEALETQASDDSLQDALQWCEALGGELDVSRAKFWNTVVRPRLQAKLRTLEDS